MIDVQGYHHVAIYVDDLERACRFYGGVLGLRELPVPRFATTARGSSSGTASSFMSPYCPSQGQVETPLRP